MAVNDKVILKGKTQKGKNRVRENGSIWVITKIHKGMTGFSNKTSIWLQLMPEKTGDAGIRWVDSKDDKDFDVTVLK